MTMASGASNAAISGQELHRFYRRTDDGAREGYATVDDAAGDGGAWPGNGHDGMPSMAPKWLARHRPLALTCMDKLLPSSQRSSGFTRIIHPNRSQPPVGDGVMGYSVTITTEAVVDCAADQTVLQAAVLTRIMRHWKLRNCISELRAGEVSLLQQRVNAGQGRFQRASARVPRGVRTMAGPRAPLHQPPDGQAEAPGNRGYDADLADRAHFVAAAGAQQRQGDRRSNADLARAHVASTPTMVTVVCSSRSAAIIGDGGAKEDPVSLGLRRRINNLGMRGAVDQEAQPPVNLPQPTLAFLVIRILAAVAVAGGPGDDLDNPVAIGAQYGQFGLQTVVP